MRVSGSPPPEATKDRFVVKGAWERFRTYLIGFGIGTVLAGMFLALKYQAARQEAMQAESATSTAP